MVARYVSQWRKMRKAERYAKSNKIAPTHAAILACKPIETLSEEQQGLLSQLIANCPTLGLMRVLAQDFREALFGGRLRPHVGLDSECYTVRPRSTRPVRIWIEERSRRRYSGD